MNQIIRLTVFIFLGLSILHISSPSVSAQTANSFFFSPSTVTVAPKGTATLKVNVGTNVVNFVGAAVKIDISKVQVDGELNSAYPLVVNKSLFLAIPQSTAAKINCNPTSGDPTCTNGLIKFALARCPQGAVTTLDPEIKLQPCYGLNNYTATGTFDIITIPLTSVNDTAATTAQLTFDSTGGNEMVKDGTNPPQDLTFTNTPASLTIPIRGDSNNDGYVTAGDLSAWRTNYGASLTSGAASGDFNGDKYVTAGDLSIWRTNYGKGG